MLRALLLALLLVMVGFSCTHTSVARFYITEERIQDLEWEGDFLACTAGEKEIHAWTSGDSLPPCEVRLGDPVIALDPRGEYLAAGGRDGEAVLLLLDLKKRLGEVSRLRYEKDIRAAAWSRDGDLLAVMTDNRLFIHERPGLRSRASAPHKLKSGKCAWLPGKPILVLHDDKRLVLCDLSPEPPRITEVAVEGSKDSIAASPCGRFIAVLDSRQRIVRVLDVAMLAVIRTLPVEYAQQVLWSPRAAQLALVVPGLDLPDATTGEERITIWTSRSAYCAAFGEDGNYLAAAGRGWVEIWRIPESLLVPWLFARQHAHKFLATILCVPLFKVLCLYALSRWKRREAAAPPADQRGRNSSPIPSTKSSTRPQRSHT